jgi:hypothetical protein
MKSAIEKVSQSRNADPLCADRAMTQQFPLGDAERQPGAAIHMRLMLTLFMFSFAIFFLSPVSDVGVDPMFSLAVSESILKHGTPALDNVAIPRLLRSQLPSHPNLLEWRRFYQLENRNGHVLYIFPHGTSLLSLPFVAMLDAAGLSTIDSGGNYDFAGERAAQRLISSVLMAIVVCIFLKTSSVLLPWSWSLIITLGAGFGTQIWSTATRALWSNTWAVFLAACLVLILMKQERGSSRCSGPLLATLVSWMYLVRPSGAITVVAVGIFTLLTNREEFLSYALTGLAWLVTFLAYSWSVFGQLLPDYYQQGSTLHMNGWLVALAGCLVSPSRGLFIFVPSVFIVVYLVARNWNGLLSRRLALLGIGIICTQLFMIASYPTWWGGWSYGPRLLTDVIPWFVVLAVMGLQAHLDAVAKTTVDVSRSINRSLLAATALLLTLLSITINGYGAISMETRYWNRKVDQRIWDWRAPQFLAGFDDTSK